MLAPPRVVGLVLLSTSLVACADDVGTTASAGTTTTSAGSSSSSSSSSSTTAGPTTGDPQPTTTSGTTAPVTGTTGPNTTTSTSSSGGVCEQGTIVCEGDVAKVCDGAGGFESEETCPKACAPGIGCAECVPGEGVCDGPVAQTCNPEGTGHDATTCDEVQGVTCEDGACTGACAPLNLGTSYIGCDYYAVITPNAVLDDYTFAVVVSNVSDEDADVTITRGAEVILDIVVPKQTVEVIPLPWIFDLKHAWASHVMVDGAYRVRSTRPVTVYQYSPLEYTLDGFFSYSNDASLLMPTNVWGKETFAVTRNVLNGLSGLYAVVAREDGTTVTLVPSASGNSVHAGAGVAADGAGVVTLDEGDVLTVMASPAGGEPDTPDKSDLTGTRVLSDRPVLVLGAHECTFVPWNVLACDHLEELNLPLDNLAKAYFVSTPWIKPPNEDPQTKARMVRIVATADATTISYEPPQNGAPTVLAKAGDYAEVQTDQDFKIIASAKVAVSEYMLGQEAGGNTGDPAMTIAVPIEQYRDSYSFHAPTNYESNFVNITAPMGATITLDGQPVMGFTAIGATGYGVARVQLANAGDGTHALGGDQSFGVQVYGYGQYTSYWYPGGLDLKLIPQ